MTDLSDFKRIVYEPEVKALRERAARAERRVAELDAALTAVRREASRASDVRSSITGIIGNIDLIAARALAGDGGGAHTHGRGCPCTPCRAEDWDAVEARLAGDGGDA